MKSELKIKTAAEYVAAERSNHDAVVEALVAKAVEFINDTLVPELDDRIANPKSYTSTGVTSFKVPHYPAPEFVAAVANLLHPLGFTVTESHDGGGMYDTIVIRWKPLVDRESIRNK